MVYFTISIQFFDGQVIRYCLDFEQSLDRVRYYKQKKFLLH